MTVERVEPPRRRSLGAAARAGGGAAGLARVRLWAEFALFFIGAPLLIALFLPPRDMFLALFALTAVGLVLLWRTPGFRWSQLWRGWRHLEWRPIAALAAATFAASVAILALAGRPMFELPRLRPDFWLLILLLYPLLSALPQELLFRALFFRRYRSLLPPGAAALVVNAACFSLAHLMYWSWIVAAMTFAGGLAFGWAYGRRGGFPLALALHAVAGQVLFTVGMGAYFYSGNVVRPF